MPELPKLDSTSDAPLSSDAKPAPEGSRPPRPSAVNAERSPVPRPT